MRFKIRANLLGGNRKNFSAISSALNLHHTRALEFAYRAVQLDPLQEENHVDLMRLHALKTSPHADADAMQQLRELITGQRYLLILDNFEHLIEERAQCVRAMLEQIPA